MDEPTSKISFLGFLASQPAERLDALYGSRWTCAALLRALPPLGKHLTLRLLHIETPLTLGARARGRPPSPRAAADAPPPRAAALRLWVRPQVVSQQNAALTRLCSLRVLVPERAGGGGGGGGEGAEGCGWLLHPAVRAHLLEALYDVQPEAAPSLPPSLASSAPGEAALESFARDQWERLLLYLVGQEEAPEPEAGGGVDVPSLLSEAGLMWTAAEAAQAEGQSLEEWWAVPDQRPDGQQLVIRAQTGFAYLLLERSAQLWLLLQRYVARSEEGAGGAQGAAQVLALLLRLSFLPAAVPQRAPAEASWRRLLGDMASLGVVFPLGEDAGALWYCVTPLAASVAAGLVADGAGGGMGVGEGGGRPGGGHVIVETNFRVYAYTSSRVELAVLQFFCRPEYLLPNLFVGALTRDSVAGALRAGVGGDQIVNYLAAHAHPQVAHRRPPLPETVADQVRLWAADTGRLKGEAATLYDGFTSAEGFAAAKAVADAAGGLLWCSEEKRELVVRRAAHEGMRLWMKARKDEGTIL